MHPIKAKRLKRVIAGLRQAGYPTVAAEFEQVVAGAMNPPHARDGRALRVEANLGAAIDEVLSKLGDAAVLAGGLAVISWIDIRESYDADFVVLAKDFEKLDKLFPGGQHKPLIYTVRIQDEDVDFLQPDNFAWTDEAIRAAVVQKSNQLPTKKPVRMLTPEYLILYKFQSGRDRDFSDIKGLLTLPGVEEKVTPLIAKYMPEEMEDFKQLVAEAEYGL